MTAKIDLTQFEGFTPGPWFVVNDGSDEEPMRSVKAARIAGQPPRHEVALCATGDSPQQMEDNNARLIAAAPALLELCREQQSELEAIKADHVGAIEQCNERAAKIIKQQQTIERLREALTVIAAFSDQSACAYLHQTGSYSAFDEPGSVQIARAALQETK